MFKVGDKVRVLCDYFKGHEGVVSRIHLEQVYNVEVKFRRPEFVNVEYVFFTKGELELVESEKKFKVGDKVRILASEPFNGKNGVIIRIRTDEFTGSYPIVVQISENDMSCYEKDELELVDDALSNLEKEIEGAKRNLAQLEKDKAELLKPKLPTAAGSVVKFEGYGLKLIAVLNDKKWIYIDARYFDVYNTQCNPEELELLNWELVVDANDV